MILFDWGTYNAYSKLALAATLGMKLTEIPPYDFSRRNRGESYFAKYKDFARRTFTTITAHAPYYNVVSTDRETVYKTRKALLGAVRMAKIAGAEIFNLHLGWRAYMDNRDLEIAAETLKALVNEAGPDMLISVEIPYTRRMLGVWDEIKALREMTGSTKLIASVQLENVWMLETNLSDHGNFEDANKQATKEFWMQILEKTLSQSHTFLSLRFSQIIGFKIGSKILKKRVPLGKGYPDISPLSKALAEFMTKKVKGKGIPLRMHIIYTGVPETKYKDTIRLFASIMQEAVDHLK